MANEYDEAKRRPPDRVSLLGVKLPPPPPKRPLRDDEATPLEPIVTMARERAAGFPPTSGPLPPVHPARPQKTLVGPAVRPAKGAAPEPPPVSTPVPQVKSDPPPRSISPIPSSAPFKFKFEGAGADFKGELRPHTARKILGWLFPALLGAGGGVVGKHGHDAVADQARAAHDAQTDAKIAALQDEVAKASTAAAMADSKANRAIGVADGADANANREQLLRTKLEERVDALGRTKAIIVKPSQ